MQIRKIVFSTALLVSVATSQLVAQDQRGYHLFNPISKDSLRDFAIDRPDITESAITVDAGHFQFEGDLVKWNRDNGGNSARTINFMNGLYKFGLSHSWDIHIGIELFNIYQNSNKEKVDEGYGSTTIRLKHNFWGNDGHTKTAFGMIPYVTFTDGNPFGSEVNYGIGLPFAYALNDQYDLGAQPQFDFILGEDGQHDLSFFQTIVIGGPVVGKLDFYLEGVAVFSDEEQYLLNGGLIYNFTPNLKVDIAGNAGLNEVSPSRAYLGLSFRI